ncbi:unnamed protein product [Linum tenue]|uniref:Uncharacterized protein n=1 Tax=Linum tenue TaxID=586396 RepID=A0AAV0I3F7_9ROSI|nr:unnamed protein product [Linum tenue]
MGMVMERQQLLLLNLRMEKLLPNLRMPHLSLMRR